MTAAQPIAPVIPSPGRVAGTPRVATAAVRPLPMAGPAAALSVPADVVYGTGRIDASGKIIVDISNPFDPARTGLVTPDGSSAAQETAKAAPAGTHVVKAFNTLFGHVLAADQAEGRPLDVFIAGDDAEAKARVATFIESLALRPLDTGRLKMAHWLEGAGLLMVAPLVGKAIQDHNFWLGINTLG